jgi:hypothetical protein
MAASATVVSADLAIKSDQDVGVAVLTGPLDAPTCEFVDVLLSG